MDLQRKIIHFATFIQLHTLRTSKGLHMTGTLECEKNHRKK